MLHTYNTLTKQKEPFKPIHAGKIGIYVCGLTVYADCHLGHGRLFIWFDVVVRYLRSLGFDVTYVRNITDIDDKIIKRAAELHIDYKTLTTKVIASMHEDTTTLNVIPPDHEPHVTDNMPQIISMIETLVNKGFAYATACGDVYYDVAKFKSYGELAHQDLANLRTGIRIEPNEDKHDPLDFALWKAAKPNEPSWPSPWGNGRPGWHIECSAMAKKYLGNTFDIHGGGCDLQFPHHQNELAQSEAANGCRFVNYWMHMGFVQIDKEKMSKSLGNSLTLKEILKKHDPESFRYFIIASHYRSPVNFSQNSLQNAHASLQRLYTALRDLSTSDTKNTIKKDPFSEKFYAAMDDDFNTPEALAVLFDLAREINRLRDAKQLTQANSYATTLKNLGGILGILQQDPETFLKTGLDENKVNALIAARNQERKNKNWKESDRIRDELIALGITIEDMPDGTTRWTKNVIST